MAVSFWRRNPHCLLNKLQGSGCYGWAAHWGRDHCGEFMLLRWSQNPSHITTSEATGPFSRKTLLNLVEQLWCWYLSWLHAYSYGKAVFQDRGIQDSHWRPGELSACPLRTLAWQTWMETYQCQCGAGSRCLCGFHHHLERSCMWLLYCTWDCLGLSHMGHQQWKVSPVFFRKW